MLLSVLTNVSQFSKTLKLSIILLVFNSDVKLFLFFPDFSFWCFMFLPLHPRYVFSATLQLIRSFICLSPQVLLPLVKCFLKAIFFSLFPPYLPKLIEFKHTFLFSLYCIFILPSVN